MRAQARGGASTIGLVVFACGALWLSRQFGGLRADGSAHPGSFVLLALAGLAALKLVMRALVHAAVLLDWIGARTATGKDGTAAWAKSPTDWTWKQPGGRGDPYWGVKDGKAVRAAYGNAALTLGPSDSGKNIFSLTPNALALEGVSKIIISNKPDVACVLYPALKARGENLIVLNASGKHEDILGESARFNHLKLVNDCLYTPGRLGSVFDKASDFNNQLISDPPGGKGEHAFWNQGSRELLTDIELGGAMVVGQDASPADAAALLADKQALEDHFSWIGGLDINGDPHPDGPAPLEKTDWAQIHGPQEVAAFIGLVRGRARSFVRPMSGESKTFDGFYEGAKLALAPFAFGPIARSMRNPTFDFGAAKSGDRPTTILIVLDADNPKAYQAYAGLTLQVAVAQLKLHPDKRRPVYILADEITNSKIDGLPGHLTLTRAWGIRWHLFAQDLQAIEETYGKNGLDTIWGECEIKQFLPGQTNDRTLERISRALGNRSVIAESVSEAPGGAGRQVSLSESGRPLITPDELFRADKALLLIRREKPMLVDCVSYAEIDPWRRQVGIDPWYGKPFLKPVKLRL